jgi:two-component system chemotaxis response regulator CheB
VSSPTRRVVVVDDSPIAREVLRDLLEAEGDITVVGEAGDGESADQVVAEKKPDLVTMDIAMPGIGGLAAIERIMARCPTPILVVTGLPIGVDGHLVFEAVNRGALDVAEKPGAEDESAAAHLRTQARRLAGLPVVRHIRGLRETPLAVVPARGATLARRHCRIVGIAASAGGPAALVAVLSQLPKEFGVPIVLVQHLPFGFATTFSEFLSSNLSLGVVVVSSRTTLEAGKVFIATDGKHLVASSSDAVVSSDEPPLGGHRPSATVMFRSLARVFGKDAAGVVLSGIGDDGAAGLVEMRQAGALTIGQDEKSCAVYGMPAAAKEANALEQVLPLNTIAAELLAATPSRP